VISLLAVGLLVLMLIFIGLGVPIAWSMTIIGFTGYWILQGSGPALTQVYLHAMDKSSDIFFVSLPLFVLMGQLVYHSRLAEDMYDCIYKWFGRLPGGLAITSTIGATGFGSVTGSSVASISTFTPMSMPEMKRYGYDTGLATASIASSGTLAMLIPPSIIMVAYGIWTETSIGSLFVAGIIPGLLLSFMFCVYIYMQCKLYPHKGPVGQKFSIKEKFISLYKLLPILSIFAIVIGGIYGGVFTSTEASGVGVFCITVLSVAMRRLSLESFKNALYDSCKTTGMIFAIIVGGYVTAGFLNITGISEQLISFFGTESVNKYVFILLLVLMYLFLGVILDTWAMVILTLPFVYPIILNLGFSPIWFGVFIVIMMEIATITPPVGIIALMMHDLVPDVPLSKIFLNCVPFVLIGLLLVTLITIFPEIVMYLPELQQKR